MYRIYLVIALALTGCAAPVSVWKKSDTTTQDFRVDSYACQKDVREARALWEGAQVVYEQCMQAHGWTPAAKVDAFGEQAMPKLLSTQAHVKPALLQTSKPWTVRQWTRT